MQNTNSHGPAKLQYISYFGFEPTLDRHFFFLLHRLIIFTNPEMCPPTNTNKMELSPHQIEAMRFLAQASQLSAYNIANVLGGPTIVIVPASSSSSSTSSSSSSSSRPHAGRSLNERQRCLLFVRILLKYLSKVNLVTLRNRTKHVVARCVHENRRGLSREPLVDTLEYEIRQCVGDVHWNRAQRGLYMYCSRQGLHLTRATQVEAV